MPAIQGGGEAPLLSLILIAYRQQDTVAEALLASRRQLYVIAATLAAIDR